MSNEEKLFELYKSSLSALLLIEHPKKGQFTDFYKAVSKSALTCAKDAMSVWDRHLADYKGATEYAKVKERATGVETWYWSDV